MTSLRVYLSLRVGIVSVQLYFAVWLICTFRSIGNSKRMVRYICSILLYLASSFCRAILHDPDMYPEPDAFKPERFINRNGSMREDPVVTSIFGFGKRICPGRHLVDDTLFIAIASLLSVFNIEKGANATDGGPDMYPFTGGGLRCGHCVSLWCRLETR
jgi:Cytochrome P450